jgi:hypothetical protein
LAEIEKTNNENPEKVEGSFSPVLSDALPIR